jgi:hypothetical protein
MKLLYHIDHLKTFTLHDGMIFLQRCWWSTCIINWMIMVSFIVIMKFKHNQWLGLSPWHKTLGSKKKYQSWIHEHKLSLKVTSFVFFLNQNCISTHILKLLLKASSKQYFTPMLIFIPRPPFNPKKAFFYSLSNIVPEPSPSRPKISTVKHKMITWCLRIRHKTQLVLFYKTHAWYLAILIHIPASTCILLTFIKLVHATIQKLHHPTSSTSFQYEIIACHQSWILVHKIWSLKHSINGPKKKKPTW